MTFSSIKDEHSHQTLCKFIELTLSSKCTTDVNMDRLVLELNCFISYKPDSIRKWYLALCDCIPFLSLDRHRPLWEVIFERFRWDFAKSTLDAYVEFCVQLTINNASAVKPVLKTCVANFSNIDSTQKCPPKQKISDDIRYTCIHSLIKQMHEHRPTITCNLFTICIDLFPCTSAEPSIMECYNRQLLVIISYIPMLTSQMLELIVERMICMDVELGKKDIQPSIIENNKSSDSEDYDDSYGNINQKSDSMNISDDDSKDMAIGTKNDDFSDQELLVNTFNSNLDQIMCLLFEYTRIINENQSNDDKEPNLTFDNLYFVFLRVFERCILPTNGTHSVQFLMFYVCSFKTKYAEAFVSRLLSICTDIQRPVHERCFAANYIGGYVAKAKYLRHVGAFSTFDTLIQWLLAYTVVYQQSNPFMVNMSDRLAVNHSLFYCSMQAVFRIYSYHQSTFDAMLPSNSSIHQSIYDICRSSLQPIKVNDYE